MEINKIYKPLIKIKNKTKVKLIMSYLKTNKYVKQVVQNPMGLVESLERQLGSVGQPVLDYKSSISHSGCGIGSHKSISSVDIKRSNPEFNINSKGNKRTQLSLSLSSSLTLREIGRER